MLFDEVKSKQPRVYRQWQEQPDTVCPPEGETLHRGGRPAQDGAGQAHQEAQVGHDRPGARPAAGERAAQHHAPRRPAALPVPLGDDSAKPLWEPIEVAAADVDRPVADRGLTVRRNHSVAAHPRHGCCSAPLIYCQAAQFSRRADPNSVGPRELCSSPMASSETEAPGDKGKMPREKRGVPGGLWLAATTAARRSSARRPRSVFNVCPQCGYHMYLGAQGRIESVLDEGTFEEWDADLDADRSAGLQRQEALRRAAHRRAEADRPARRRAHRHRHDPRPPRGLRRHRFGVHHGQHGLGRRRAADPARSNGPPSSSCR